MTGYAIEARGVRKVFRGTVALEHVDLEVPRGSVLGLLGHNGAGKTTLVNILCTLVLPTSGWTRVTGLDVVRDASRVRSRIGLTGQFASVDEQLSGRRNLVLIARLLGATRVEARDRAEQLLTEFGLSDAADRLAGTYSGGMRRRLDLAASLVGRPEVLFLDEPTTGLDPLARLAVWDMVSGLAADGTTVLLTTQLLEEADRLADSITVLSHGRVVANGTAAALKAQVGSRVLTIRLLAHADVARARDLLTLAGFGQREASEGLDVTLTVDRAAEVAGILRLLDDAALEIGDLTLAEPSLDDFYLGVTRATGERVTL